LSVVARLFDPLGFLAPYTVLAKCLLQEVWKLSCEWDEILPTAIQEKFEVWRQELSVLNRIRIPRWSGVSSSVSLQMHTFCDATLNCYGATSYLRILHNNSRKIEVRFLAAKSRIAPIKLMCIPRLELLGAVMGARLSSSVAAALTGVQCPQYFWKDSLVALRWVQSEANTVESVCGESSQRSTVS
jgi:hypothetical protein